jgi:hypothetical protein
VRLQTLAKPSRELLELRTITQRLLMQNRPAEADRYSMKIASLEREESRKCSESIQRRYEAEGRTLKETFATRKLQSKSSQQPLRK